jgi:hypothetical protein
VAPLLFKEILAGVGGSCTCTRLGLRISNLALVVTEVVARGPAKDTEF